MLAAAAAYLINFEQDYNNTTPVNGLFSRDNFDCSVIHNWSNDKSTAVIGGVTSARTPSRKWELNSHWLTSGKNVVRCSAAVCGEERCVTTLKTPV